MTSTLLRSMTGAASLAAVLLTASPSSAQLCTDSTFPCGIQVDDVGIQKVPAVFKFQARVSQAKLPIGQGTFPEVVVKLLEGSTTICSEQFQQVEVRESVLNLEIGRNMSCELDEEIAKGSGLAFQVCLGSADSCLKPIELSTVPFAVRASFASAAQEAHTADEAAVSHYALRASADRDLALLDTLSTGYFDFSTPGTGSNGHLRWAPVRDSGSYVMTITGTDASLDLSSAPAVDRQLDRLVLDAESTSLTGALLVDEDSTFRGDVSAQGALQVVGNASLLGDASVSRDLRVGGALRNDGLLTSAGHLTVESGGVEVTGASVFYNDVTIAGTLSYTGTSASVSSDLNIGGTLTLEDAGGADYPALHIDTTDGNSLVLGARGIGTYADFTDIDVASPLTFNASVATAAGATANFEGDVNFSARVDFSNATEVLGLVQIADTGEIDLGNWTFSGDQILQADGLPLLEATTGASGGAALRLPRGFQVPTGTSATIDGGLVVGGQAVFSATPTFQSGLTVAFGPPNSGGTPSLTAKLLTPSSTASEMQIGGTGLDSLRFASSATFDNSTTLRTNGALEIGGATTIDASGSLTSAGEIVTSNFVYFGAKAGAGWRIREGEGLQHASAAGDWKRVLNTEGGNQLVSLNRDSAFTSGVKAYGNLETTGRVTSQGGLTVNQSGVNRLDVSDARTRVTNVLRADGGIEGSGLIKTTQGNCLWTSSAFCPSGQWMQGSLQFSGQIYCCSVYLTQ